MSVTPAFSSYLVSPEMLHQAIEERQGGISNHRIVPLSAAWFLSSDVRKGIESFEQKHIPNSQFCDLDLLADKTSPFPHMIPSAEQFASVIGSLGITPIDTVVVYDTEELGVFSAPRVAWLFKVFRHKQVHILNNFRLWVELGLPTESGKAAKPEPKIYPTSLRDDTKVILFEEIRDLIFSGQNSGSPNLQVFDSRSSKYWNKGSTVESGLETGHMPFSIHVPLSEILDTHTKAILPSLQLRNIFETKGIDQKKVLIASCGAGITAAVIEVALEEAGYGTVMTRRLYDGSWREWSTRASKLQGLIV